jgi:hypothetical protein
MQEHYRLADGVSEVEANLIFNNAACNVITDAFKHVHCISIATYYTQLNLLLFCTHVLKLLFFTLTCKCNSLLHASVESGIYLTKERHLQGNIDWLVKDPEV